MKMQLLHKRISLLYQTEQVVEDCLLNDGQPIF